MQKRTWAVVLTFLIIAHSATALRAQPATLSLADLIEQTEPSCVRLDVRLRDGQAIGSGFVVEHSNWVVTNYHVIAGALKATAGFSDDSQVEVEGILAFDKRRDVAVLKLAGNRQVKPLKLADKLPRKGEAAIAIGAPQGLSFTAAEGIISAIRDGKELKEFGNDADGTWLQTSTPISPGSSGGPLLNRKGEILGANSGTLASGQNLNFAICAEDIGLVLKQADKAEVKQLASIAPPSRAPLPRPRPTPPGAAGPAEQAVCKLPAERRFRHRFKIGKEEDEFDKVVWLRTQWLPLKHNDPRLTSCGLRVGIPYREDNPAPFVVWEIGATAKSFAFIGPGSRTFQMLIDDESVALKDPTHKGEIRRGQNGLGAGVAETLTTLLRLDAFLDMIMASRLKARIGVLEFELSKDQFECLRDLASQLPTGETAEGELLVMRFSEDEDPSIVSTSSAKPTTTTTSRPAKPTEKTPSEFRKWTSADGKFSVEARFVKLDKDNIVLARKDNGKEITVPLDRLSANDRAYARKQE